MLCACRSTKLSVNTKLDLSICTHISCHRNSIVSFLCFQRLHCVMYLVVLSLRKTCTCFAYNQAADVIYSSITNGSDPSICNLLLHSFQIISCADFLMHSFYYESIYTLCLDTYWKHIYLEKLNRLIIWNGESTYDGLNKS